MQPVVVALKHYVLLKVSRLVGVVKSDFALEFLTWYK